MFKLVIKVTLSILLFVCLLDMPYGYYQLVRFLSLVAFVILGYSAIEEKRNIEAIIYFGLAVLFQPLFKIALGRTIWNIVDTVVGVGLILTVAFEKIGAFQRKKSKTKEIFVVHFDDHSLFTTALKNDIEKDRKDFKIHSINEYYSALKFISDCFENNIQIDAVITDLNHPGPSGYDFAGEVKHIAHMNNKRIPVILLTMAIGDNPRVLKGLEESVFDKHLTKEADSPVIIETIESLLIPSMDERNVELEKPSYYWLRWIGVLPASVACYFLGYAIMKLSDLFWNRNDEGAYSLFHWFIPCIASGVAAFYFVSVGTLVAPFHKKIVSQILMILVVLVSGMGVFLLIAYQFKWDLLLETLGQIAGAVIAFNQSNQIDKEQMEIS